MLVGEQTEYEKDLYERLDTVVAGLKNPADEAELCELVRELCHGRHEDVVRRWLAAREE